MKRLQENLNFVIGVGLLIVAIADVIEHRWIPAIVSFCFALINLWLQYRTLAQQKRREYLETQINNSSNEHFQAAMEHYNRQIIESCGLPSRVFEEEAIRDEQAIATRPNQFITSNITLSIQNNEPNALSRLQAAIDASKKQWIGDANCKHNAWSPELRCAINPCGPCEGCRDFEKRKIDDICYE